MSRAIALLPADSRLTSSNYDLTHSILERSLGEVNGWLSVPLEFPPTPLPNESFSPATGEQPNPREESSSREREDNQKQKRSSRDRDRREDRRDTRRQPPTPPSPPRRGSPSQRVEVKLTASSKRKSKPEESLDYEDQGETEENLVAENFQKPRKKNKGIKHRKRGKAYRAERDRLPDGPETPPGGSKGSSQEGNPA